MPQRCRLPVPPTRTSRRRHSGAVVTIPATTQLGRAPARPRGSLGRVAWTGSRAIARIRRAYFVQEKSINAICRELHVSRKVVRKVLRSEVT